MAFLIGFLTLVMVLDCVIVVLLVLIQLPKKDAGAGVAFGGGATDALFGAGSGTVLTKVTKWAAITFFGLALLVGTLQSHNSAKNSGADLNKLTDEQARRLPAPQPAPATAPTTAPATAPVTAPPTTAPATTPAENPEKK